MQVEGQNRKRLIVGGVGISFSASMPLAFFPYQSNTIILAVALSISGIVFPIGALI